MRTPTLFLFLLSWQVNVAQEKLTLRPSPLAVTSLRYKDSYIKIVYSQPTKRGREIFGKLVPYGEVWRTGANEATEITLTRDVFMMSNQLVTAGTYTLLTIPEAEKWTIILNKDVGLWGAYNYNSKQDALRFEVPTESLKDIVYEPFTIQLDQKMNQAFVSFFWDRTKVSFPITFIEPKP
jgi:hypothetical protein